jgi:hypothetical protein
VAILLIINAVLVRITDSRLEKQLAAIRAAGDPLSIAELIDVKPIPPEQDAAVYLRRARDGNRAIREELDALHDGKTYEQGYPTEAELKRIQSAFEAYPNVIPLLGQAAACEEYVPQFDPKELSQIGSPPDPRQFLDIFLSHVNGGGEPTRTLANWAVWLRFHDRREEALQTCITMLKLSRHVEHEPTLVGYLVAIACRRTGVCEANYVLQSGPVSNESRRTLEEELARYEAAEGYRRALVSERAFGLDNFRTFTFMDWWIGRAYWNREKSDYLDLLNHYITEADQPFFALPASDDVASPRGVFSGLIAPAIGAARVSMERSLALTRALRVLNALERQPQPEKMPAADLSDLGLPKDATTDPFTGKPLRVKKLPEGWLVYSVGDDLQDDGGKVDEDTQGRQGSDVGLGPIASKPGSQP